MLIFVLDDEPLQLEALAEAVREAAPEAQIRAFGFADAALLALREEGLRPDVVFSDIEMPGMSGMELARMIRQLSGKTNVVFVTGYRQYAAEAYDLRPSGYVLKPVDGEKIRRELRELRYPPQSPHPIRVQCFGSFEVFAGGKPLRFRYAKTKELFAYLVDRRGAALNTSELCVVLWEDMESSPTVRSQFRNLVADLTGTLSAWGGGDVVQKGFNSFSVNVDAFECDLYAYLAGDPAAEWACRGEYMSQYSWAEATFPAPPPRKG